MSDDERIALTVRTYLALVEELVPCEQIRALLREVNGGVDPFLPPSLSLESYIFDSCVRELQGMICSVFGEADSVWQSIRRDIKQGLVDLVRRIDEIEKRQKEVIEEERVMKPILEHALVTIEVTSR